MKQQTQFRLTPRAYGAFLKDVYASGAPISPRGIPTWEILGATVTLDNPRDRIVTARSRKMNIAFAIAEWFSFMLGIDNIDFFTQFIGSYGQFSTDGQRLDGCYGTRINTVNGIRYQSQLNEVARILQSDPMSRQAVMSIYERDDLYGKGGKNTPCTLNLQFLIRDGRLDMITYMRSSDVYKGITNDIVVFTLIQEFLARQLDVELGKFTLCAGSLHIYNYDVAQIEPIRSDARWPLVMKPMPVLRRSDLERGMIIFKLATQAPVSTAEKTSLLNGYSSPEAGDYVITLSAIMASFVTRHLDNKKIAEGAYNNVNDRTLRYVLRPWLVRAGVLDEIRPAKESTPNE